MMKFPALVLLLINLSCFCFAQDELTFKIIYKPSTKYNLTTKQTTHTEATYSGSDEFLEKLKEKGVQNPTITKVGATVESEFNTGKLNGSGTFPVTMVFIRTSNNDNNTQIPDGTTIYGTGTTTDLPTFDSVASATLSDEFKEGLLLTMKSLFSQVSLPEKKLKVGESFSQETPLSIPIGASKLEMVVLTGYRLVSINNGVGNFDIVQTYTLKTTIGEQPINATGKGKGSLQYDISNNFYNGYQLDSEIIIKLDLEGFSLDVKSNTGFTQTTAISKK